jgi:hypothetical protein
MPSELNYASSEEASIEMARIARRIVEETGHPRGEAAAEVLLAIATGRLNLRREDYLEVLKPIPDPPPFVSLLMSICEERGLRG